MKDCYGKHWFISFKAIKNCTNLKFHCHYERSDTGSASDFYFVVVVVAEILVTFFKMQPTIITLFHFFISTKSKRTILKD